MKTTLPVIQPDECCTNPNMPAELPGETRANLLAVFKALSDGTRLDVFRLIAAQDEPICACDIVDRFDVSQPTIAHHLKTLRQAGLITVSRRGIWAYYAIDPAGMAVLESVSDAFVTPTFRLASVG